MTFTEFISWVEKTKDRNTGWRIGQTYFNLLRQVRPDLSEQVRGTEFDPFHQDTRIKPFLAWVGEHWERGK